MNRVTVAVVATFVVLLLAAGLAAYLLRPLGTIVYLVNLDPAASTSKLSEEILSANLDNVDSVEWDQKESKTYLYR